MTFVANLNAPTSVDQVQQLARIENDMRSNLTAYFAPLPVVVTFGTQSARRRLMSAAPSTVEELLFHDKRKNHQCSPTLDRTVPSSQHQNGIDRRDSNLVRQEMHYRRSMLQTTAITLFVNVTFPLPSSNSASGPAAIAFNNAMISNANSVLSGFQQGWGSTGITGVQLIYLIQSAPTAVSPIASPSGGAGSAGSLIGVAVAAIVGCSFLAGQCHLQGSKAVICLMFVPSIYNLPSL